MRCPRWLWRWIDNRGRIPAWVRWIYPHAHFCCEMDYMLIIDRNDWLAGCFCDQQPTR